MRTFSALLQMLLLLTNAFQFHQQLLEDRIKVALYNITADPTEHEDLSAKFPDIVKTLQKRLQYYNNSAVAPLFKPPDPKALEIAKKNGVWGPWEN